jgi:hypothetical protein
MSAFRKLVLATILSIFTFAVWVGIADTVANAQTYQQLGGIVIGSDGSTAQSVGDHGYIVEWIDPRASLPLATPEPPRQTFCQPLGSTLVCNPD